jgi:FkbM family methyltransferase
MQQRYFSQCGEDFLLWKLFGDQRSGYFIDVGAFDGILFSNTYSFELSGWRGICIEPHRTYFPYCEAARRQSICLNLACIGDPSAPEATFFEEDLGLLSGILPGRKAELKQAYARRGRVFPGFNETRLPARTLDSILSEYLPAGTPIDFISIDVEGSELDVLRGFDVQKYRPKVMIIEANTPAKRQALSSYMTHDVGYHCARKTPINVIFTRDPHDIRILRRTKIDCTTEAGIHPLGPSFAQPNGYEAHHIRTPPLLTRIRGRVSSTLRRMTRALRGKRRSR